MLLAPPTEPYLSYDWLFPFINLRSAEIKFTSFHATQDFLNSNSNFANDEADEEEPALLPEPHQPQRRLALHVTGGRATSARLRPGRTGPS